MSKIENVAAIQEGIEHLRYLYASRMPQEVEVRLQGLEFIDEEAPERAISGAMGSVLRLLEDATGFGDDPKTANRLRVQLAASLEL